MRFEVRPLGLPLNNSRPTEFNEERNCTDEDSAAARGEVKICAGCTYKNVSVEATIFLSFGRSDGKRNESRVSKTETSFFDR